MENMSVSASEEFSMTDEEEDENCDIISLNELVHLAGEAVTLRPRKKAEIPIIDTTSPTQLVTMLPGDVNILQSFNAPVEVQTIPFWQSEAAGIDERDCAEIEADRFLCSLGLNGTLTPNNIPLSSSDDSDPGQNENNILLPEKCFTPDSRSEPQTEDQNIEADSILSSFGPDCPHTPTDASFGTARTRVTRTRSVISDPKTWAREQTKMNRMTGEKYMGYRRKDKKSQKIMVQDTPKEARTVGPVCPLNSKCSKWTNRECHLIDDSERNSLFNRFWKEMDWGEKKMYICSLVHANEPKRKSTENEEIVKKHKPKSVSYSYFLLIDNKKKQVCQKTFLNTFGLKNSTVRYWVADYWGINKSEQQVDDNNDSNNDDVALLSPPSFSSLKEKRKEVLQQFLNKLHKLPSHYCRASSNRLYFQTDISSWSQLFCLYLEYSKEKGMQPLSRNFFARTCKAMRLSIFHPKKDQCDICTGFKHDNVSKEKYDKHVLLKTQAREEKAADKTLAENGKAHVICCDMMAVKLLPCIQTSVAYYKMKLAIHNYTIYNLADHDAICFWFTENESNLQSSVFATCLNEEINRLLDSKVMDVIIYSDGCGYQNRNAVLSNALLSVSMKRNVTIHQKFLERGHTQMEGDSVHSVIETACKKKEGIYLPHEMIEITKEARKLPLPYRSKMMYHNDFKNYNIEEKMRYLSIRPGNKANDAVVTDIRCLKYTPEGFIFYKLRYDDEFQQLPRRPKNLESLDFPALFEAPLPIPKDKWDDLQSLRTFIPRDCHQFYEQLPHSQESYKKTVGQQKKAENGKRTPSLPSTAGPSGLRKTKNKAGNEDSIGSILPTAKNTSDSRKTKKKAQKRGNRSLSSTSGPSCPKKPKKAGKED